MKVDSFTASFKKSMGIRKKCIGFVFSSVLIFFSLLFLQRLVMPKYMESKTMGALTGEYYRYGHNHDVLFVGDCEICTAFSPPYLWENYGINSYVRGSVQQTTWQTYYLLSEMLEEETPAVVIFNVAALKYEETVGSAYNRMTLDGMKWSWYKVMAVKESLKKEEDFLEYLFPILFYHERITSLKKEDFTWLLRTKEISYHGYLMINRVVPYEPVKDVNMEAEGMLSLRSFEFLDKIKDLCEERNIQLLLIKGPGILPYWYECWDKQVEDYAEKNQLRYVNLLEKNDEIGIDYEKDTFSGGRHMNVSGAEKMSEYMGRLLLEEYEIADRRNEKELKIEWGKELEKYHSEKDNGLTKNDTG